MLIFDVSALGDLDRATRGLHGLIDAEKPARVVLLSSLRLFARYPSAWHVTEQWAPRPTTAAADLAPYLAELTLRELSRVRPIQAICLRLEPGLDPGDRDRAIELARAFVPDRPHGWWLFHVVGAGSRFALAEAGRTLGYAPRQPASTDGPRQGEPPPPDRRASDPPRRVLLLGAGGPLGAAVAAELAPDHVLRLADRRPIAEIEAENRPARPGAPVARVLGSPHEAVVVDVTEPDRVHAAAQGVDAIVNCTVVRDHPVESFRVNVLGAHNAARAALAHGVRRLVQTGPRQSSLADPAGYWYDFDLPSDLPPRPGDHLYFLTKSLGQELLRVFAAEHGLEVPVLLFGDLVNPAYPALDAVSPNANACSWADTARAVRQALRAPLPRPYHTFNVVADMPHGKYRNDAAKALLGWEPRDRLERYWLREGVA